MFWYFQALLGIIKDPWNAQANPNDTTGPIWDPLWPYVGHRNTNIWTWRLRANYIMWDLHQPFEAHHVGIWQPQISLVIFFVPQLLNLNNVRLQLFFVVSVVVAQFPRAGCRLTKSSGWCNNSGGMNSLSRHSMFFRTHALWLFLL